MTAQDPEPDPEPTVEADPVQRWRAQFLREGGYPEFEAVTLAAEPRVDVRRALKILAAGCPPQTALRILL